MSSSQGRNNSPNNENINEIEEIKAINYQEDLSSFEEERKIEAKDNEVIETALQTAEIALATQVVLQMVDAKQKMLMVQMKPLEAWGFGFNLLEDDVQDNIVKFLPASTRTVLSIRHHVATLGDEAVFNQYESEKKIQTIEINKIKAEIKLANLPRSVATQLNSDNALKLLKLGIIKISDIKKYFLRNTKRATSLFDSANTIDQIHIEWMEKILEVLINSKNSVEASRKNWVNLAWILEGGWGADTLESMLSDNAMLIDENKWFDKSNRTAIVYHKIYFSDSAVAAFQEKLLTVEQANQIQNSGRGHFGAEILKILFTPIGIALLRKAYIRHQDIYFSSFEKVRMFAALVTPNGLKAFEEGRIINPFSGEKSGKLRLEDWQKTLWQVFGCSEAQVTIFLLPNYKTAIEKKFIGKDNIATTHSQIMQALLSDNGILAAEHKYIDPSEILSDFPWYLVHVLLSDNGVLALSHQPPLITTAQAKLFFTASTLEEYLKPDNLEAVKRNEVTPKEFLPFKEAKVLSVVRETKGFSLIKEGLLTVADAESFKDNLAILREIFSPAGRAALKSGSVNISELFEFKEAEVEGLKLLFSPRGLLAKHEKAVHIEKFRAEKPGAEPASQVMNEWFRWFETKRKWDRLVESLTAGVIQQHLDEYRRYTVAADVTEHKAYPPYSAAFLEDKTEMARVKSDDAIMVQASMAAMMDYLKPYYSDKNKEKISEKSVKEILGNLDVLNRFNINYYPTLALKPHELIEKKLRLLNNAFFTVLNTISGYSKDGAESCFHNLFKSDAIKGFQKIYYQLIESYFKDPSVQLENVSRLKEIVNNDASVLRLDSKLAGKVNKDSSAESKSHLDVLGFYGQKKTSFLADANKLIDKKMAALEVKKSLKK